VLPAQMTFANGKNIDKKSTTRKTMKCYKLYIVSIVCILLAGCVKSVRSISHSNYREGAVSGEYQPGDPGSDPAFNYRGELSEYDILGITRGGVTSETEIRRALDQAKHVRLRPGSSLLLIQSGAVFPDGPMVTELGKHFTVIPFSGVPQVRKTTAGERTESFDPESYAKSLRLTAARGGAEVIVCYWGVLESENEHLVTKTVSWVPIVNWMVPDEKQHMRIRLKIAVIDVGTGDWAIFTIRPFEDERLSRSPRREVVDQKQVERLKQKAYEAGATELVRLYSAS